MLRSAHAGAARERAWAVDPDVARILPPHPQRASKTMSKYAPLADYLRNLDRSEVTLSFDEIERLLGFRLPPTAGRFRPYWSNSGVKDGHPGRLWREAGWRQIRLDLTGRHVSFRRSEAMPFDLESLRPKTKGLLYELLQDAGFSVEE